MSVVVAVTKGRRTIVAADSLTCAGHHRHDARNLKTAKVQRLGRVLICSTGWSLYDNILSDYLGARRSADALKDQKAIFKFFMGFWKALHQNYPFVNDQCGEKDAPFGDLDASFMIVNRAGIFGVSPNMDVAYFQQYHAIGCGKDYAFGALNVLFDVESSPGKIAEKAVQAAIRFDIHCGGDIQLFEL